MSLKLFANLLTRNVSRQMGFLILQQRTKSSLISQEKFKDYELYVTKMFRKIPQEIAPKEILETVKKISDCRIKDEDNIPGPFTIHAYEKLEKPSNITGKSLNQIQTLAWGAEMVCTHFLILNDIEDNGTKYKGQSLWDIHDASLLRSFVYEVLKINFNGQSPYVDLVHLFDKAFFHTAIGHQMDVLSKQKKNYSNFDTSFLDRITEYKAFHMFQFPVMLAMRMTNNKDDFVIQQVQSISKDLGRLYQMKNDYLNCYGTAYEQPGLPTHSKDIQTGRCSWLFLSALQRCTTAQRIVLTTCYGSTEPSHVERVKLLYDQLLMPKVYKEEKEKMCEVILSKMKFLDEHKMVPELFLNVLNFVKDVDS